MTRWIKNIALMVVSITIALLICEGIVRIFGLGGTSLTRGMLHQYDPDAGWRCYPNLDTRYILPESFDVRVRCNSQGLRDSEKRFAKPPGIRRIVVLGDSFMWGYGVENEEMFSAVLQDLLSGSETVNFGVNGYSTVQELVRLEIEGLRYEPDVTVLVFVWNDLEDNFDDKHGGRPVAVLEEDNSLRIANRPVRRHWKSPLKQWFCHHSHLFRFGEYNIELLKLKFRDNQRAGLSIPKIPVPGVAFAAENDKKTARMKFSMTDIYAPPGPEIDFAWKAIELLLGRIKQLTTKEGGRLVVVYAASLEAVDRGIFVKLIRKFGQDPDSMAFNWDRPSNRLGEVCAALDIPYVNLNPVFRQQFKKTELFSKKNPHWSMAGHRLAAQTVAEKIKGF
ncbi:MAG: SGNH/GDSL hydrolase family protein [Thermodesulfobacteriota bacterium]|nr:SGNH/GDSL hydrolase family protein [Thermodesulfobacteriota bacterium]